MKLQIVIPALNEEASIRSIIERSLAARRVITEQSPVTEVAITVVSDGSSDQTVARAREYGDQIHLIVFEKNRGYGAAIMEGWRQSDADLLAFVDADGTCDPDFFAVLCRAMAEQNADVALGCRMNKQSKMPLVRRFGNRVFAAILTAFSMRRVRDSASGMRVVLRSALPRLMPLPTGLHFTPAMSARAILSRDVKIVEMDMPYHEREGRSKLNPIKDGLRFLRVIFSTAMLHKPSRPLGFFAVLLFAAAVAWMVRPTLYYFQNSRVEEWMIYRFIVGEMLGGIALLTWCAGYLGRKSVDISLSQNPADDKYHGLLGRALSNRFFWIVPALCVVVAALMVRRAMLDFVSEGRVLEHWSRFIAMAALLWTAAILSVTWVVDRCMNLLADRLQYMRNEAGQQAACGLARDR